MTIATLNDSLKQFGRQFAYIASPAWYRRSALPSVSGNVITIHGGTQVNIGSRGCQSLSDVTLDIDTTGVWDDSTYATAANRAGKDFYIYAIYTANSNEPSFIVSANSSYPSGYDATTSRKIGGFHCLCLAVGTISSHTLTGYATGAILPQSIWDLRHRARSENEGMVWIPQINRWADIYLPSWSGSALQSVYGGTIVDGGSSKPMHGELFNEYAGLVNKQLITRDEFVVASQGSNQGTNIYGSADPTTTGGHKDTANRRMISNYGLEDCCGVLWQWTSTLFESLASIAYNSASNNATLWSDQPRWYRNATTPASSRYYLDGYSWFPEPVYNPNMSGDSNKGSCAGLLRRCRVGGDWGAGSYCGSRCASCNGFGSSVDAAISARLVSEPRTIDC